MVSGCWPEHSGARPVTAVCGTPDSASTPGNPPPEGERASTRMDARIVEFCYEGVDSQRLGGSPRC
jgi:hypothetical protein